MMIAADEEDWLSGCVGLYVSEVFSRYCEAKSSCFNDGNKGRWTYRRQSIRLGGFVNI